MESSPKGVCRLDDPDSVPPAVADGEILGSPRAVGAEYDECHRDGRDYERRLYGNQLLQHLILPSHECANETTTQEPAQVLRLRQRKD